MTEKAPISLDGATYAERWTHLSPEAKLTLAGSVEGVDRLDTLAKEAMADETKVVSLLAARKRKLRQTVGRYRGAVRRVDQLRSERNLLMIEEAILGEQQQRIAENAEVTAMIVAQAIGTSTKRRGKAS